MAQYSGDPSAFPVDFYMPDDSASPTAAEVNVGLEALGDRTAYLHDQALVIERTSVLDAAGSIVVPPGCHVLDVEGCGGGGGGGGGRAGGGSDRPASGGGGGAGAQRALRRLDVTPGETLTYVVGAGGSGGASNTVGSSGSDSTVSRGATVIARFRGGGAGQPGSGGDLHSGDYTNFPHVFGLGGIPISHYPAPGVVGGEWRQQHAHRRCVPGEGGHGIGSAIGVGNTDPRSKGLGSAEGYSGGVGGSHGTTSTTYRGGGGGGGGGGGPYGDGAAGGNGGNANGAGASSPGSAAAAAAAANTGAGGGGGGGGGGSNTSSGAGGSGSAGGSGRLTFTFFRKSGTA